MSELRYDNQVFVITGAGGGLGKAYAKFFASRGGQVVVNDLGGSFKGEGSSGRAADLVVSEIKAAGGNAVADYHNVEDGDKIVETAIRSFGRVDVLINNAGILRDISFKNMTDQDWDLIMAVHIRGAYKCTRAAWPYFRKQRYGRVINTTSASGLFGSFGQVNYSAAKLALVGFTETLASEGIKYNIVVNALAPAAASRMTETVMPPEFLQALSPEWVVPVVAVLVHSSNTTETGSIIEAGAGHFSKLRWERSEGAWMRPDETFTPGVVLKNWSKITDFLKDVEHPKGVSDSTANLKKALALPPNTPGKQVDFRGKVALVTGAGNGLGRAYSHLLAKHGARVVVNDVKNTEAVVREIKASGGEATGVNLSVEDGEGVIRACINAYGRIDIIVNNAGILRDKSFSNMTDDLWESVIAVHLRGAYKITKAAWPYMLKQKYGRIVNITSTTGIYGKFGQANYATAKAGILGFGRALAREGVKYNIHVNTVAPSAGTDMTRTVMPEELVQAFKPDYVAPLIVALCTDKLPNPTGGLYEGGAGWFAATRWQRTRGIDFPHDKKLTAEEVAQAFKKIVDFDDGQADHPESPADASKYINANFQHPPTKRGFQPDQSYLEAIEAAKRKEPTATVYTYTDKEVILYNISLGAKRTDLPLVYENSPQFQVLPTFGIVPTYSSKVPWDMNSLVPNFNKKMLLHGEQYLEILQYPIPTSATLITTTRLIEVVDKGTSKNNAAIIRRGSTTVDAATSTPIFYNESVSFIRGSGGFGGRSRKPQAPDNNNNNNNNNNNDRSNHHHHHHHPAATATHMPPQSRPPDHIREEKTTEDIASLYRLLGDRNPLHIDPAFSAAGGFRIPILHGLCTFGIAGKHVVQRYGPFRNIKVRFAGTVLPGQTLRTEMWKVAVDDDDDNNGHGDKVVIVFQVRVVETGDLAISNAAAELLLPAAVPVADVVVPGDQGEKAKMKMKMKTKTKALL